MVFDTLATATGVREQMTKKKNLISWVVYRMTVHGKDSGMNAVCEQS